MRPHLEAQDAIRASDRAVLAFYGPGHPSALTCNPAASYNVRLPSPRNLRHVRRTSSLPATPPCMLHGRGTWTGPRRLSSICPPTQTLNPEPQTLNE